MNSMKLVKIVFAFALLLTTSSCSLFPADESQPSAMPESADVYPDYEMSIDIVSEYTRSEAGIVIAEMYYEQPVFTGKPEGLVVINQFFDAEAKNFFADSRDYFFESVEHTREIYSEEELTRVPASLYNRAQCTLMYSDSEYVSIKIATDWMAGGVRNTNEYGFTFSVSDGCLLSVDEFTTLDYSEFNDIVVRELYLLLQSNYSETFVNDIVGRYTFSTYRFYIDENTLFVVFDDVFNSGSCTLEIERSLLS